MALEYIHGRKILHRDIKASNIFLTGNNTVKLGDFGISRVLENTWDAAMTVVGTPYYMSPEVCENKPYTFKSDVWSLGWVLYELWTLDHAFSADNLLGLVYKIVQDKQAPIPSHYSEDLKTIVELLLLKDGAKRPLISELLITPFIKDKMEEFISNGGFIGDRKLHVRKVRSKKPETDSDSLASPASTNEESKMFGRSKSYQDEVAIELTPKEKMLMKKKQEADMKAKQLNEHTKTAVHNYAEAKQRKHDQYFTEKPGEYHDGDVKGGHKSQKTNVTHGFDDNKQRYNRTEKHGIVIGDKKKVVIKNWGEPIDEEADEDQNSSSNNKNKKEDFDGSNSFGDSFAANDRAEQTYASRDEWEDTFGANEREEELTSNSKFSNSLKSKLKGEDTYKLSESDGTLISGLSLEDSTAKTIKNMQKAVSYDERKIVSSGRYDPEEYYYNYERYLSDEFEEDDDATSETPKEAEKDPQELTSIVDNYKLFLKNDKPDFKSDKDEEFEKVQKKLQKENNKIEDIPIQDIAKLQIQNSKSLIEGALGTELYTKVYKFLRTERENGTEDPKIHKQLRKMIPSGNNKMLSKCFDLDQIVFMEILKGI